MSVVVVRQEEEASPGRWACNCAPSPQCGTGQTVHSKGQMEHFGMIIDNKSCNAGGKQCIIMPEGYTIPIHVHDGLPRIDMWIPTDAKMDKYPHVFLTADSP